MTVKTRVSNNLLVSPDNASTTYKKDLEQERLALLEPTSTINGIKYYYTSTTNVNAIGDAINETYVEYAEGTDYSGTKAGKAKYDAGFNTNYGVTPTADDYETAFGYVDYNFYLKAVNTDAEARALNLTELELLYNDGVVADKAWRVALIVKDITSQTEYAEYTTAPEAGEVVSIFTLDSAANFDSTPKAIGDNGTKGALLALNYGSSKTSYNQSGVLDASIASGATKYYRVIVRLWLEGEDTTCTNTTYARLTDAYSLDLAFELGTNTAAVNKITTATAITGAFAGTATTVDEKAYYKIGTTDYYADTASKTDATKFYTISGAGTEESPYVATPVKGTVVYSAS